MNISCPGSFKTLATIVGNVLSDAPIILRKTSEGSCLYVDSMDPMQVCCIKAQFPLSLQMAEDQNGRVDFTLKMKLFNNILKHVGQNSALEIYQVFGDPKLKIVCTGDDGIRSFEQRTIQADPGDTEFVDINSFMTIHLELSTLKSFLRAAKDLRCEEIAMIVERTNNGEEVGAHRYFTLQMRGDEGVSSSWTYQSSAAAAPEASSADVFMADEDRTGEKMDVYRRLSEEKKLAEVYNSTFPTDFLVNFTRGIDRNIISLSVGKDSPLILNYELGPEGAEVQYILAPQVDDADMED